MKRMLSFFLTLAVVVAFISPSLAASGAMDKAKNGAKDVITSPLAVKDNVMQETKNAKFLPFALVGGLLKGGFYMGKQIVSGVLAIVTSPLEMSK
ncbi:MAG: hypothetical protein HY209_06915 [Candidatus Omnitrophica bacterium]|nr:hypothetical protein [Candidatus Omnitrophota bacterium]